MNPDTPIRELAVAWAIAMREPDFNDWEGFTAWLEADLAHAEAYDALQYALEEADAGLALLPAPGYAPAANENAPGWLTSRRGWLGGAIAAALVLALSSALWLSPGGTTYQTGPGETRLIALGDGGKVELAGGSRIAIEGTRMARLEEGQALFTIRHDEANPFVLTVGDDRLVDAGTVFDVRIAGETLDLTVAEGAVIVNPAGQNLKVPAGGRAVRGSDGRYRPGAVDPHAVGEWRRGRISFEAASLAEIAAELSRATGTRFTSADRATRLSGSIATDAVRADPRALEPLLGVSVREGADGWEIAAR